MQHLRKCNEIKKKKHIPLQKKRIWSIQVYHFLHFVCLMDFAANLQLSQNHHRVVVGNNKIGCKSLNRRGDLVKPTK